MAAARHLVARQTLEVHSAERMVSERLAARAMAASALLAEAIESSLDAAGAVDVRFRIDRLEVDLGPCDPGHWERDLAEGIRAHLAAGLAAAFKEGRAGPVEPLAAALALVAHFCRSGSLPWWARPADSPETAVRALAHCASATGLLGELLLEAEAVERLVNQLREPFLVLLLETVRPGLGGAGGAFIDELEAAARKAAAARGAQAPGRKQIWRSVLTEAGTALSARNSPGLLRSGSPEAGNQAFERSIAAGLGLDAAMPPTQAPGLKEAAKGFAPAAGARSASLEERRAAFTDHIQTLARRGDANFSQAALRALVGQLDEAALGAAELLLERAGPEAALEALRQPPPHSFIAQAGAGAISETLPPHGPDRSEDEHDCLWIETAGLVLLWPFLPSFFERLGLTEEDRFRDPSSAHRAVALLHHLATGALEFPEQELPLPKLLAGLDVDCVHYPGDPLRADELDATDAFVGEVLEDVPMLGKLSREGFRRAWLDRPGSLTTRDGHWLLRVGRQEYDVLLERLPWVLAYVQLPWMPDGVQVEW